jgi:Domain of unknown function (DUF4167)
MNSKQNKPIRRGQHGPRAGSDGGRNHRQGSANWKQSHDRYLALARAAASSGDVVEAENYFQHAEHYFRLMHQGAQA